MSDHVNQRINGILGQANIRKIKLRQTKKNYAKVKITQYRRGFYNFHSTKTNKGFFT